ncbi:MAG TPA: helix-turn-helix domain-containing protein [Longimicrobium sp.]|nr:helix-turn-helix domain-containing protein [Longimicrobium sp.]
MSNETIGLIEPTTADVDLARRQHERLMRAAANAEQPVSISIPSVGEFDLPGSVFRALAAILHEIADGNSVAVQTVDEAEISTTDAAALLGMSRPTLINVLDAGEIPFRWIGSHRRLSRSAVLAYRARLARGEAGPVRPRRSDRLRALEEMAEATDALGLGY